ncbi:MAG: methylated-DNA--[protein]-cysteine S-methyltransferase [Alphaproteobacteria bacterium]|jgi:methylated-DNA-[protein]-cysteine S-methyltransferase
MLNSESFTSPIGKILVRVVDEAIYRVDLIDEDLPSEPSKATSRAIKQLEEYFLGKRKNFDVAINYKIFPPVANKILDIVNKIPYGKTKNYKQIGEEFGKKNYQRHVGTTCANNSIPIIIPCHRVIGSDGGLRGYIWGLEAKQYLLDLEKNSLNNNEN